MLSPKARDAAGTLSQVQACQRQVSELRTSLSLLAERCGCLEDVHTGTIENLRAFGSSSGSGQATLEQLKKQSTAKVRGLQNRHGELMRLLQDELSRHPVEVEDRSKAERGPKPKAAPCVSKAGAPGPPTPLQPLVDDATDPLTLESEPDKADQSVTVMPMDGRAARLNSRLRCSSAIACNLEDSIRGPS